MLVEASGPGSRVVGGLAVTSYHKLMRKIGKNQTVSKFLIRIDSCPPNVFEYLARDASSASSLIEICVVIDTLSRRRNHPVSPDDLSEPHL